jgi:hypothetical protein
VVSCLGKTSGTSWSFCENSETFRKNIGAVLSKIYLAEYPDRFFLIPEIILLATIRGHALIIFFFENSRLILLNEVSVDIQYDAICFNWALKYLL